MHIGRVSDPCSVQSNGIQVVFQRVGRLPVGSFDGRTPFCAFRGVVSLRTAKTLMTIIGGPRELGILHVA
jgi:hypothetical protein